MERDYSVKAVTIGRRSRKNIRIMRRLRPLAELILRLLPLGVRINLAIKLAGPLKQRASELPVRYRVLGGSQGLMIGTLKPDSSVVLYLHGGGFMLPIMPAAHVGFVSRLCRDIGAPAWMPDYRLAPLNKYPAALDDCEQAYRALLDTGFTADRIMLAGESAGGNLVLGLLQRIRRKQLPMPGSAVSISPVGEMGRVHMPPSRFREAKRDAMIPPSMIQLMLRAYAPDADASDPELSPMLADFSGFPPLYVVVAEEEVLRDDALIIAERAREDGVDVKLDVWPTLPHAFPLLEGMFVEAKQARQEIGDFLQAHCGSSVPETNPEAATQESEEACPDPA